MRRLVLAVAAMIGNAAIAAPTDPPVLIEHVRLIDGRGGAPRDDVAILIADGKIAAIGPGPTVNAPDDFRNNVPDGKTHPKIAPEVYQAVIAEAHSKGLRVAAHIHDLDDAKAMVAAGIDIIAHGVRDAPVDGAFIAAMKQKGVRYIPTLSLDKASYIFAEHPEWLNDPVCRRGSAPSSGLSSAIPRGGRRRWRRR
jgi:imidazolonepropionase-like amidohydrolase